MPEPEYALKPREVLLLKWHTAGRHLKNTVSNPLGSAQYLLAEMTKEQGATHRLVRFPGSQVNFGPWQEPDAVAGFAANHYGREPAQVRRRAVIAA